MNLAFAMLAAGSISSRRLGAVARPVVVFPPGHPGHGAGHSGYTVAELWEQYIRALRTGNTGSAQRAYYEYLAKGGDRHRADTAMMTGGRSATEVAGLRGFGAVVSPPAPVKKALREWAKDNDGNYRLRTKAGVTQIGRSYFYRGSEKADLVRELEQLNRLYLQSTGYRAVAAEFDDGFARWPKMSYMWLAINFTGPGVTP